MISLLQLNSNFPRVAGDVGCAETFNLPLQKLIVEKAKVSNVVSADISSVPIEAFEASIHQASGKLITTSCGFLAAWQFHFERLTHQPFVSSALIDLAYILGKYKVSDVAIVTFCSTSLTSSHVDAFLPKGVGFEDLRIIGLPKKSHLRCVIEQDLSELSKEQAEKELIDLLEGEFKNEKPKCVLLECTNLPPYKVVLRNKFQIEFFDILTAIERRLPNAVKPEFL